MVLTVSCVGKDGSIILYFPVVSPDGFVYFPLKDVRCCDSPVKHHCVVSTNPCAHTVPWAPWYEPGRVSILTLRSFDIEISCESVQAYPISPPCAATSTCSRDAQSESNPDCWGEACVSSLLSTPNATSPKNGRTKLRTVLEHIPSRAIIRTQQQPYVPGIILNEPNMFLRSFWLCCWALRWLDITASSWLGRDISQLTKLMFTDEKKHASSHKRTRKFDTRMHDSTEHRFHDVRHSSKRRLNTHTPTPITCEATNPYQGTPKG